jgi:Sensors of blue-light using FAD
VPEADVFAANVSAPKGELAGTLTSRHHAALRGRDMSLFRLVYASTSLLSDEPDLAREQIEEILLSSRRNNEAAEITGALLFSDTNFSQVLEGPRSEVERLYEILHHDPRHKDLILLLSEPMAARQFPDWSMAYIGPHQWAKQAAGPPSPEPAGARRLLNLMGRTLNHG